MKTDFMSIKFNPFIFFGLVLVTWGCFVWKEYLPSTEPILLSSNDNHPEYVIDWLMLGSAPSMGGVGGVVGGEDGWEVNDRHTRIYIFRPWSACGWNRLYGPDRFFILTSLLRFSVGTVPEWWGRWLEFWGAICLVARSGVNAVGGI